ncbi:MAG: peptidoglycan DD-metalloendopeptidase family protein [Bacteroidales bacterium]|nr:peptidoglycan DD-metalloendopeptidase family protein [Bacteroidales bacterium]
MGLLLLIASPVGAQTKKQLEREKQQIEQQIKKLNAELDAAKKNTKSSSAQLNVLNKKIQERTRLINNINSQMQLLDRQIGHTQDSIAQLQIQIDSLKHEYGNIIRVLYAERNRLSGEVFMMDADSYNRAFLRRKYFQEYSRYRKLQAAAIRQREDEMQTINNALQRQKNEKNNLLSQEQNQKNALAREKQQQQRQLTQSQQREKNLKAQLSKKEKERIKLQQQIQKIINEEIAKARRAAEAEKKAREQAARNAKNAKSNKSAEKPKSTATDALSSNFASNKGKLSWPVYYKKVSREYGRYTHESGGENMNNGIDLITASGADVFAIFNGTVSRVFTCPNGTKGIIVRHGDYMTVYANLGSVAVSEGKQVSTKQKLGTVHPGTDGTSEFSFQIWKSTQSQNPRNWLR